MYKVADNPILPRNTSFTTNGQAARITFPSMQPAALISDWKVPIHLFENDKWKISVNNRVDLCLGWKKWWVVCKEMIFSHPFVIRIGIIRWRCSIQGIWIDCRPGGVVHSKVEVNVGSSCISSSPDLLPPGHHRRVFENAGVDCRKMSIISIKNRAAQCMFDPNLISRTVNTVHARHPIRRGEDIEG